VSWVIAACGCLIGILGIGVALGARLRIASLEQELTLLWRSRVSSSWCTTLARCVPRDQTVHSAY
jgi:hypothetical protein